MDFRDPNTVGTFPYHCHILEHEDKGMMGSIRVDPASAQELGAGRRKISFAQATHFWLRATEAKTSLRSNEIVIPPQTFIVQERNLQDVQRKEDCF
jgi:hypothetical protein